MHRWTPGKWTPFCMAHKLPWMVLTIEGGVIKPDKIKGI